MCYDCEQEIKNHPCQNKIVKTDCGYNMWAVDCKNQRLPIEKWCDYCKKNRR